MRDAVEVSGDIIPLQTEVDEGGAKRRVSAPFPPATAQSLVRQGVLTNREAVAYMDLVGAYGETLPKRGPSGVEARTAVIVNMFREMFEAVKVLKEETYYYRYRRMLRDEPGNEFSGQHYDIHMKRACKEEIDDLVTGLYQAMFPTVFDGKELERVCGSVRKNIATKIDSIDHNIIAIGDNYLYDMEEKRLCSVDSWMSAHNGAVPKAYRRLFASSGNLSHDQVRVPTMNKEMSDLLESSYYDMLLHLNKGEEHPYDNEVLNAWACGNTEVYRDILRMYSTAFMKRKPLGVYFLVGVGRNGKTSCIDLWASMVGTDNFSRVAINQLGDKHFPQVLRDSLVNAPDETKEQNMSDEEQTAFKTAADHGDIETERMYGQDGFSLCINCAIACPVNHIPNWRGSSAEALLHRTLPIPFLANFAYSDLGGSSWGEVHFTPEFMMKLTGQVLAYATYYAKHPWVETQTMAEERQSIEEATSSNITYARLWEKYFRGYEHFETVSKDYENWCGLMGLEREDFGKGGKAGKGAFSFWNKYNRRSKMENPWNHKRINIYISKLASESSNREKAVMFDNYRSSGSTLMDGKSLSDYHVGGGSIVYALEEQAATRRGYTDEEREKYGQGKLF